MCTTQSVKLLCQVKAKVKPLSIMIRLVSCWSRKGCPVFFRVDRKPHIKRALLAFVVIAGLMAAELAASAKDGVADHAARYSACVGEATASVGFDDMVGHAFAYEVNCLAYYGIAFGTSRDGFSPGAFIKRLQMALFLTRAARVVGIPLPSPTDQGFEDIDNMTGEIRDAINQMSELGIMEGYTVTEFRPEEVVTRQDMAAHLDTFLGVAPPGPVSIDIEDIEPDDKVFSDIDRVGAFAYDAIRRIYELGITTGTAAGTFDPHAAVTRGQMAAFITRTLAHTNLRPVGISIQVDASKVQQGDDLEVMVSLRDEDFDPIVDEYVDVFATIDPDSAFERDGRCSTRVAGLGTGSTCFIDSSDATNADGNLVLDVEPSPDRRAMWAWSGDQDDEFDLDRTKYASLVVDGVTRATAIKVTDDMKPAAQQLGFGESVTFGFQLVDEDGDHVAFEGIEIDLTARFTGTDSGRTITRLTIETDANGRAEWSYKGPADPSSASGESANLDLDARADYDFEDETTRGVIDHPTSQADQPIYWSDEEPRSTTLRVTFPNGPYQLASEKGAGSANLVRATLTDQYGDPVAGVRIEFFSDDPDGLPYGRHRTTNSRGEATLSYNRDAETTVLERIWAEAEEGSRRSNTARHYWAIPAEDGDSGGGDVVAVDTDADIVVVRAGGRIVEVEYDSNDQFFLRATGADSFEPVTRSEFEKKLDTDDALSFAITETRTSEVNTFRLTSPTE